MRPQTASLASILILSSIISCGTSYPFSARRSYFLEVLSRRSPYAVVPVDGGLSSNHDEKKPSTTQGHPTISTIAVAGTLTSIETEIVTLPPITDYVTSTKVIEGPTITKTSEVTITPLASLVTIIRTSYSVVDISSSSAQTAKTPEVTHATSAEPSFASTLPSSPLVTSADHSTQSPEAECTEGPTSNISHTKSSATQYIPTVSGISSYLLHNPSYPSNSSFPTYSPSVASAFITKTNFPTPPSLRS
ncbi:hypothetical protein GcC1_209019 [Golovinomyces cichoracearum]|uniref:Uncharacterized protein n=1 Tax=Golovinomyces cichoracearum TaxID=62708 RepID=A0A420HBB6_9PEZI|nr:hypothetical protein GcC1_209019 [Golovinomyces cichoracearum]